MPFYFGYTANGLNQYSASGGVSLGYDARGNLTSSGSDTYTYSSENLLLTGPGGASLSYGPLLRLGQVSSNTALASRFVYDGGVIVAQANSAGTFNRRFVLVPGSDEIIAEYKPVAGVMNWKLTDERGSVMSATVDSTGAAGAPNSYDEYGIPGSGNAGRPDGARAGLTAPTRRRMDRRARARPVTGGRQSVEAAAPRRPAARRRPRPSP